VVQHLNNRTGDLKNRVLARLKAATTHQAAARSRKLIGLVIAILLTWGALHVALVVILSTAPIHH
jgi:hypothetical protein